MPQTTISTLLSTLPQEGTVEWIGLRPARRADIVQVDKVLALTSEGLVGDRYSGSGGKRQVTLIQSEHLPVIASVLGTNSCDPALLRRNIAVSGVNLLALKGKTFEVGNAVLEYTGICAPCSFMEATFGPGGYNAVRGHGGITAQVIKDGEIKIGSTVRARKQDHQ